MEPINTYPWSYHKQAFSPQNYMDYSKNPEGCKKFVMSCNIGNSFFAENPQHIFVQ